MDANIRAMIGQIDDWAAEKIRTGDDPPWAWYHLMQLRDAIQRVTNDADGVMHVHVDLSTPQADNE